MSGPARPVRVATLVLASVVGTLGCSEVSARTENPQVAPKTGGEVGGEVTVPAPRPPDLRPPTLPATAGAPPPPLLTPWYDRQKWSLLTVVACVGALFAAGVLRGEHRSVFSVFRRVRLLLLLLVLATIGLYAVDLQLRRDARTEWSRPLHVAVVLVERGPLRPGDVARFLARSRAASDHLWAERRRYYGPAERPFWFHVFGPVPGGQRPAAADETGETTAGEAAESAEGLLDRLFYGFHLRRFLGRLDDAAGLDTSRYDARMYVFATPSHGSRGQRFVEGLGEAGGDLGMIDVDFDETMIDAAWIALAHETLHTLGARDKYSDEGRAQVPHGLAEPDRDPLYPQRFAEIMAGEIALSPTEGRLVDRLEDVRVGPATAQEIRW